MDILNIMQCTHLGGMEQASLRLMRALQARGHRCRVLSLNPLGPLKERLDEAGIPAIGLPYRGALGWRSFPELCRQIRRERADSLIMTGHNLLAMLALGELCEGRRLLAIHVSHVARPRWQWRIFYGLAKMRFTAISFPSDAVRLEAEAIVPQIKAVARTIRNPLEPPPRTTPKLRANARKQLGLPANAVLIGNAGWLIESKRFDIFLQTAAIISEKRPDAHFVIAGDGTERARLAALAASLGIADRVSWLGWLDDMQGFYRSLDLLLFNSDWEAMPNTPLEAMINGIPVVASLRRGGLKELITDERFGFLIDQHDPAALAAAVLQRLPPEGIASGKMARARAVEISDPASIAATVERILEGNRPPAEQFASPAVFSPSDMGEASWPAQTIAKPKSSRKATSSSSTAPR